MRDIRGTFLPPRRMLRAALFFAALFALLAAGAELYQRRAISAQRMTVSAIGRTQLFLGVPTTYRVVARDEVLGRAMRGVEVSAEIISDVAQEPRVNIWVPPVITNDAGVAQLPIHIPEGTPPGTYRFVVVAKKGQDKSELDLVATVSSTGTGASLTTDRPRYEPGQTVHMRGLVRDNGDKPVVAGEVEFIVTDMHDTVVAHRRGKTSAHGIVSADVDLTTGLATGAYGVRMKTPVGAAEQRIEVGYHKTPTMKATLTAASAERGRVTGEVQARYVFGQPATAVKVRVVGTRIGGAVVEVMGDTDGRGTFGYELEAPPGDSFTSIDVEVGGDGREVVRIHRDVSKVLATRSEEPLHIQVVPEAAALVRGFDNAIYFVVTDDDGKPVSATIRGVATEAFTITSSELGVAKLEVEPKAFVSALEMELSAEDVLGRWGHVDVALPVSTDDGAFRLRTDRASYAPGDTVTLFVRSELPGIVHVDFIDAHRTLASTELEVIAGRGEGTAVIPEGAAGLIELSAVRHRGPFRATLATRRVYVVPKDELDVKLSFDEEAHRPGGVAQLDVAVTTADGRPQAAALSLLGVDAAVVRQDEAQGFSDAGMAPWASALTARSPELSSVMVREGASKKEQLVQRALLAAAPSVGMRRASDEEHAELLAPFSVLHGDDGQTRRIEARWRWSSEKADVLKVVALIASGIALLLWFMIVRHALDVSERARREGVSRRGRDAWSLLAIAALGSGVSAAALLVQVGFWRSTVVFGAWTVLWAGSGALMWHAAARMSRSWALVRLAWSVCAMHVLTHGVAVCALSLGTGQAQSYLVLGGAFAMLTVAATVGATRIGMQRPGVWRGAISWMAQLAIGLALTFFATRGFDIMVRRYVDPLDDAQKAERAFAVEQVEDTDEPLGVRAKGEGGDFRGYLRGDNVYSPNRPSADVASRPVPRVRRRFPKTLLWQPEVLTNEEGRATVPITLPDSVTTWNLHAAAVDTRGADGSGVANLRAFQPFFADVSVPRHVSVGDEVSAPVVVFNYTEEALDVELAVETSEGLTASAGQARITLEAGASQSTTFVVTAEAAGHHEVKVVARSRGKSGEIVDAVARPMSVHPAERRVVRVVAGDVGDEEKVSFDLPESALERGRRLSVKLYPGVFSQVSEGLSGVFKRPHGCFEQTAATTYPSLLALAFLDRTGTVAEATEAQARVHIEQGYQRLLGFEVRGGGFSLFGDSPANPVLTAHGLMLLSDMRSVNHVDRGLMERAQSWLVSKRGLDGRWDAATGEIVETAFITWALADSGMSAETLAPSLNQIASMPGANPNDPYVLVLRANALLAGGRTRDARGVLARLLPLAEDGHFRTRAPTLLFSRGASAEEETTALAALALVRSKGFRTEAEQSLRWLVHQRGADGVWSSSSATVAAMRALLLATPAAVSGVRKVGLRLNEEAAGELVLPEAGLALVGAELGTKVVDGANELVLRTKRGPISYQAIASYLVPWEEAEEEPQTGLSLEVRPDRTSLGAGEELVIDAEVAWRGDLPLAMPMVEIGVPPTMEVVGDDLDALRESGKIALWARSAQHLVLYLPTMRKSEQLRRFSVRLRARHQAKVLLPSSRAYAYYDPAVRAAVAPVAITVR